MKTLTLPKESSIAITACVIVQLTFIYQLGSHSHFSFLLIMLAILISAFIADMLSGIAHFTFDYVWPDKTPIFGPISIEFREHHEELTLEYKDIVNNLTKGAYGAVPILVFISFYNHSEGSAFSFLAFATAILTSIWILFFHQVHTYLHIESELSVAEFTDKYNYIIKQPHATRKVEFEKLFNYAKIPWYIRILQKSGIILSPDKHWEHHISFETKFSSLNGWSDPLMNTIYRPLARHIKNRQLLREGT